TCLPGVSGSSTSARSRTPLSLHDALPISGSCLAQLGGGAHSLHRLGVRLLRPEPAAVCRAVQAEEADSVWLARAFYVWISVYNRSEEHTSELQSRENLVCRLLLEKKNYTP